MTVPLCGVRVDPNGTTQSVSITDDEGATPTVYSDAYAQNTVALPKSISSPFTFYLPNPGTWTVAGTTITLEGSQVGSVTFAAQSGANGLPTAPAAVSKALRIMAPFDDGTVRDLSSTSAKATNAASPLTTPTYDGSGQIAEIDIFYSPEGWGKDSNGKAWRYWMVNGPYPNGSSNYENPSLLVSDDGQTWQVPPGLTNPIGGTTTGAGNSDPSMFVDIDGTMYVYWANNLAAPCNLQWSKSTDGITWTAAQTMLTVTSNQFNSPQIVWDGTQYWLFMTWGGPQKMYYATASSPTGFTSAQFNTSPTSVTGLPANPGHINLRFLNGRWYVIFSDQTYLYFASSLDGKAWSGSSTPVLSPSGSTNWDSSLIYRTAFLVVQSASGPALDLWYVGANATTGGAYRVGYARMPLVVSGGTISGSYSTLTGNGSQAATTVPFTVKAAASQSADLLQVQNSAGSRMIGFDASGHIIGSSAGSAVQIMDTAGGSNYLRMLNTAAWADSKNSTFFQVGKGNTDYLMFSSGNGQNALRLGFAAAQFAFSSAAYTAMPAPGANDLVSFSTASAAVLAIHTDGSIAPNQAQASLTGTTAGTAVSSQPFTGASYKKALVYLSGYENTTATAQTITFPVAFTNTPYLAHDDSGGATVSTTTLTLPASMAATKTGWIVVEGF